MKNYKEDRTEKIASTYLGKKVSVNDEYNPGLLVAIPRSDNRKQYDIHCENLPFEGFDVWHAYEFSCLTNSGLPVTRLLKLNYNCESEFLVESKSLKLYLNSFNMTRLGRATSECLELCKSMIEKDLSRVLKTKVTANFIENNAERIQIFEEFVNLMEFIDEKDIKAENYKEAPELLQIEKKLQPQKRFLMYDSLRSNCRVTHQPDFGDVFIYYNSKNHIKEDSLIKYLISFRSEFHFHEECCEMIFKRLYDILDKDDELFVCALYTRRGGIDICPARWTRNCIVEDVSKLIDVTKYARKSIKQ